MTLFFNTIRLDLHLKIGNTSQAKLSAKNIVTLLPKAKSNTTQKDLASQLTFVE